MFGRRLIGRRVKATTPKTTSAAAHMVTVTRRLSENSMRLIRDPSRSFGRVLAARRAFDRGAQVRRLVGRDNLDRRALLEAALAGDDHAVARGHPRQRL